MEQNEVEAQEQFPQDIESKPVKKIIIVAVVFIALALIAGFVGYNFYKNSKVSTKPASKQAPVLYQSKSQDKPKTKSEQVLLKKLNSIELSINSQADYLKRPRPEQKPNLKLEQEAIEIKQLIGDIQSASINNNSSSLNRIKKLETLINNLNEKLVAQLKKLEQKNLLNPVAPFLLTSVDIWDGRPQATIKLNSKNSLVDIGDKRVGWKIIDINFDTEQIKISSNNKQLVLEVSR